MRSRKRLLLATTVLATSLTAGLADAAPPGGGGAPPTSRSSSQFTLRREEAGGNDAAVARQRARAGDCAGALPAFDAAINVTIEPTLRRDRGLCHEKLGDPYPAIDDYRAYISSRPDAPDADQIRERLAKLEEQVGVGAQSAASFQESNETLHIGGSFSQGTQGGITSGSTEGPSKSSHKARHEDEVLGARPGEPERGYDYYAKREEIADASESSPLRYGTGWIVGPFLTVPRYFVGSGVNTDLGFAVGATFRYAWTSSLTFITELGYVGVGESGQPTSSSGPLVFAGVELRVPLDTWATNNLILGIGPGYEHYTTSGTQLGASAVLGRGRFGFRHVFGAAIGLEITADGGPAFVKPDSFDGKVVGLIGASVALVIGF